jgi:predicted enzyme related to lactoylglutathione lyase
MAEATQGTAAAETFCWHELMTRDVPAAREFYTELLGWTTEEMDMGEMGKYTLFKKGEEQIGGMMAMPDEVPQEVPPHWMTYIAVDDIDALANRVNELGGMIHVPPTDIPNIGRFCVIQDPTGGVISLFQGQS